MRLIEIGSTAVKLELRLFDVSTGAVTGAAPTVAIRRKSDNFYLDFNDNTFKASGWTTRTQTLAEQTGNELAGVYSYTWNTNPEISAHGEYAADFAWTDSGVTNYETEDLKFTKLDLAAKILANKLTINSVTGVLSVYEDDQTTVAETWPTTDKNGATTVLEGTGPANRGAPT